MILLKNKENGTFIGTISESQLQYLLDQLEEEHIHDQDYWINTVQIEVFKQNHADSDLVQLLEGALDDKGELEFVWERQ